MDATQDYVNFFLNSRSSIVRLECLEISHPNFSRTYYIVRNASKGISLTHEDGIMHEYEYWPCRIAPAGSTSDLDYNLRVDLGDLGEILPKELEAIMLGDGMTIKPICTYRIYRSDRTDKPIDGPYILEIKQVSYNGEGCSFEAAAPIINGTVTGEIYDLDRFPSLRGFVYAT